MEADDEWEDHLIVSYTPQQGSEMTMTEFERLKEKTKFEIIHIKHDMTPEAFATLPKESVVAAQVCQEAAKLGHSRGKYLYFLGPSSTPGQYWAGVGPHLSSIGSGSQPTSDFESSNFIRYAINWNNKTLLFSAYCEPVILDNCYSVVKKLKRTFIGLAQTNVVVAENRLTYISEKGVLCIVDENWDESTLENLKEVKFHIWDERNKSL